MKPGVGSTSSDLRPPFESIGVLCVLRLGVLAVEGRSQGQLGGSGCSASFHFELVGAQRLAC